MKILKKLSQAIAVSGNEDVVFNIIKKEINPDVDELYLDNVGNFIAHKKGDGKKILICAHADEVGFVVTDITQGGMLRFSAIGSIDPITCINRTVEFPNGTIGTVHCDKKVDKINEIKTENMFIDIGEESYEDAKKILSVGDTCVLSGSFAERKNTVTSKALDNRIGVYILTEAIKNISKSKQDLYFVFTSQSEMGNKNAMCAAYNISPDIMICVDITPAYDFSDECKDCVKLGYGPAIKVMDKSIITHSGLRNSIIRCAKECDIKYQFEVIPGGGTDAGNMQTVKGGFVTGVLSIPLRYVHTPCETANKHDIDSCIKLITEFCKKDFIFV